MFFGIAGFSAVSHSFFGMIRCPVVRDVLWNSRMFCRQLVVY